MYFGYYRNLLNTVMHLAETGPFVDDLPIVFKKMSLFQQQGIKSSEGSFKEMGVGRSVAGLRRCTN